MFLEIAGIALATFAGGLLPLVIPHSDRLLHRFIAFATGVFLGAVFLHLLPEVARLGQPAASLEAAHGHAGAAHGAFTPWFFVLAGVVGLYLIEHLLLSGEHSGRDPRHAAVGWASYFGLCVHAFTAGLVLAASRDRPALWSTVLISIASHKLAEGFSLTTVFALAQFPRKRVLSLLAAFSLVTPAGVLLGMVAVPHLDSVGAHVVIALAAGAFLYVALCDLLPEVFHHREDAPWKIVLLALGATLTMVFERLLA